MDSRVRVGGTSAVLGVVPLLVALAHLVLDDLAYQGTIASNPIPPLVALGAGVIGAPLLFAAMWGLLPTGVSPVYRGVVLALAGLGLVAGLVPVWPIFALGMALWSIGALLLGIAGIRHGGPRVPAWGVAIASATVLVSGPWGAAAAVLGIAAWGAAVLGRRADLPPRARVGKASG